MRILFFDTYCPKPYSPDTLLNEGMGGTEATAVRLAEKLSEPADNKVYVMQHNREMTERYGAEYLPFNVELSQQPDVVIVLRNRHALRPVRARFPKAHIIFWLHDVTTVEFSQFQYDLDFIGNSSCLCVSKWHKHQTMEAMKILGYRGGIPVDYIYNPIPDTLEPDETVVDKNKLVFFSSPHKGLERTLEVFQHLRNFNKDFKLFIANPGYMDMRELGIQNVHVLGVLPNADALKHVREALCVMHLNSVFPETQGIVYQEANAVGTPFITHDFSAIPESSYHAAQLVDVNNNKEVIDRIMAWYGDNRPKVRALKEFRMSNVIRKWNQWLTARVK